MSFNMANIKWVWVTAGIVVAMTVAILSSICVVTLYSGYLGFQAQGAPDMDLINEFAASYASPITSVFIILGTFLGGLLAGRKAAVDPVQHGVMVGIITAIASFGMSLSGGLSVWGFVGIILALVGGWLGGRMAARSDSPVPEA